MPFDYAGDYYKANVLNFPLGGNFNSRLELNIREDKGWSYGISSFFSGSKLPGFFGIGTDVRRSATDSSVAEIMKIVKDFTANGMNDEELSFTKNAFLNSEAIRYESPGQKAGFLSGIIQYNLPPDFKQTQAKVLKDLIARQYKVERYT